MNDRVMVASRILDGHARPDTHGIWYASLVLGMDLATCNGPQGPESV